MLILLALACTDAPAPATSSSTPATPPPRRVVVALNWYPEPEFGGFYDALLSGAYREAGLEVEILPGGPGVPVLEMLASGKADVAVSAADDLLLRRAQGLDAVAIFAAFQDSPVGLLVHAASGVRSFEDVKGPVAMEVGSPFQLFLASRYGWGEQVELVPTSGGLGAFATNPKLAQQGYVTSEPCVAEGQGLAVTFLPGRDAGWNPYASLAVVRGADKETAWVAGFHAASRAGWLGYLADPARANAEIAKLNPNLPAERLGCIVERQRPYVEGEDGLGAMTVARWEETAAALSAVGRPASAAGAWVDLGSSPAAAPPAPASSPPPSPSTTPPDVPAPR